MQKNIILIGMPGSGKSTVGVILAKTLGYDFLDSDLLISKKEGKRLQNIIDSVGMQNFLDIEKNVICSIKCEKTVIATGGSAVCREESMVHLKKLGVLVYLNVPFSEIERRVRNITTRGIAFEKGETLYDIFRKRTPIYRKYANIFININRRCRVEQIVEKIVEKLDALNDR